DVLQQFHREIGIVAFCLVLVHPTLLVLAGYPARILLPSTRVPWGVSLGTGAFLLLTLLIASSLLRKRPHLPYQVWQVGHAILTVAVIVLAAIHVGAVGRYVHATPMAVLWAGYLLLVALIFANYRLLMPLRLLKKPWRVVENREEAGDSRTLYL